MMFFDLLCFYTIKVWYTSCAVVTGVQTCALPISRGVCDDSVPAPLDFARDERILRAPLVLVSAFDGRVAGAGGLVFGVDDGFGFVLAFLDAGGGDDVFAFGDVEEADAGAVAADDAGAAYRHADELGLVGDQHELLAVMGGEAGDDRAVAGDVVDVGDALAAAVGAAVDRKSTRLNSSH